MEMNAEMNLGKKSVETLVRSQHPRRCEQTPRDARRDLGKGIRGTVEIWEKVSRDGYGNARRHEPG
jgi:hypothetical protein